MKESEWKPIAEEGRRSFDEFALAFEEHALHDPKWKVEIIPDEKVGNSIKAIYSESETPADKSSHEEIVIRARMNKFSSSGVLSMRGPEKWEFRRSDDGVMNASGVLTNLLQEAGIQPKPCAPKENRGRKSNWNVLWDLYPESHPRIQNK